MPRRATSHQAPQSGNSPRRAIFIALALVAWMFVIGARLVQLQVNQHDQLAARARNQQLSSIDTAATRGQVLDRQGRELARSLDTESFYADPSDIENVADTAKRISSIIGSDAVDVEKKIADAKEANKKFIWIARRIDLTRANKLDELDLK